MPIIDPSKLKCNDFPGILLSKEKSFARLERIENQAQSLELLPVIKCIALKENSSSLDIYGCDVCNPEDLPDRSSFESIDYKDSRNVMPRISVGSNSYLVVSRNSKKTNICRQPPVKKDSRADEGSNSILSLMSGSSKMRDFRFKRQQEYHQLKEQKTPRKLTSILRSSVVRFSNSNNSLDEFKSFNDINEFDESVPKLNVTELSDEVHDTLPEENELLENFSTSTVTQGGKTSESAITPASDTSANIQESSFSSIEPYPLPETPSLLLLEPLLLMQQDIQDGSRNSVHKTRKRRKEQLTRSEQQKVTRIMIGYTLAFFLLAIVTFYVVYFV
ncbi:hypothetical protein L9F63_016385 [Diploptera punctata]|uniref:Uncharacterized protein n=1 Tax=Diploptera punctata TaxID=6984 RepID=A0AAD8A104_DIPPU|nr:hypothetical protein L9F63_016385 [Diploptera punctata]